MTRSATDFSRYCRAPLLGAPGGGGGLGRLDVPDVRELESKSALGAGGSPGPGPSTPGPALASSPFPRALGSRPSPRVLFGDEVRRVQLLLDSPPSGCELPRRLQTRVQPLRGSYASWGQDGGVRALLRGRKGERPRPTQEAPSRCLRWGSRRLSSVGCSPYSHGSSPKTEVREPEGVPSPEFPFRDW